MSKKFLEYHAAYERTMLGIFGLIVIFSLLGIVFKPIALLVGILLYALIGVTSVLFILSLYWLHHDINKTLDEYVKKLKKELN